MKGRLDNGNIGYESATTSLSSDTNSFTFTVNAAWRGCVSGMVAVSPSTTYMVSGTTGTISTAAFADYYSSDGWISRYSSPALSGDFSYSFTTPANCAYIRLSWQASQVGTITITNPQLELGSTATSYEPYQGQSYEVNLGKNLFDKNADTGAYRASKSIAGEEITITSTSAGNGYVAFVIPNSNDLLGKTCSISIEDTTVSVPGAKGAFAIYQAQEASPATVGGFVTNAEISGQNYSKTFTFPASFSGSSDCFAILLYPNNSGGGTTVGDNTKYSNIQIEKGSQATTYAAYFAPIELCKIGDYQDYIYKSGGKWYKHKEVGKYQLDGTINWYVTGTGNYQCSLGGANRINLAVSSSGLSNYFPISNSSTGLNMYPILQGGTDYIRITNATSEWASTDLFKTFITDNAVYLYYPLAESAQADTEITSEALITQLDALLNNARTYAGVNNIFTVTPNKQGTLEITYYTEKDADKRDELIIDSRMRTVTLNGTDVYHLIAAGSEFPMLAPGENKLMLRSDIPGDNGYAEVNYKQGYLSI